jgi:hypothetical protein
MSPNLSGFLPRLLVYVGSLLIASFYLLSTVGWFFANYLALTGSLGEDGLVMMNQFTLVDAFVRVAQVVLVSIASILLIMKRKASLPLFVGTALSSMLCTTIIGHWGISFLAGLVPLLLIVVTTMYVYWQVKVGLLK